ncbi:MAG: DUF6526 family protein [Gemmatimonadota bacterium]|nr:DUF6526 family protein [Gemmatimonadota bacterium]
MSQSFANHTRWFPWWHFFAAPILFGYAGYRLVAAVRQPSLASAGDAVVAVGIAFGVTLARVMAITVQNRVIRLEERLRLARLLPAADADAAIAAVTTRQLIALRFAPDAELPGLVRRVLSGELTEPKAIKQAVQEWRADWLRV